MQCRSYLWQRKPTKGSALCCKLTRMATQGSSLRQLIWCSCPQDSASINATAASCTGDWGSGQAELRHQALRTRKCMMISVSVHDF
eukprot:1158960-Pelagomonas_calceolata.AAC.8